MCKTPINLGMGVTRYQTSSSNQPPNPGVSDTRSFGRSLHPFSSTQLIRTNLVQTPMEVHKVGAAARASGAYRRSGHGPDRQERDPKVKESVLTYIVYGCPGTVEGLPRSKRNSSLRSGRSDTLTSVTQTSYNPCGTGDTTGLVKDLGMSDVTHSRSRRHTG